MKSVGLERAVAGDRLCAAVRRASRCLAVAAFAMCATAYAQQGDDAIASHACTGYNSPGTNTVVCRLAYPADRQLLSLLWRPVLPEGWVLIATEGDGLPELGPGRSEIVLTGALTNNPVEFVYRVAIPPGVSGEQVLRDQVEYQLDGSTNETCAWVGPDPLVARDRFLIMVASGANGTISPCGVVFVAHGACVTFVMEPDRYYHLSELVVDSAFVPMTATNRYELANVTCGHRLRAVFDANLTPRGTPEWWLAGHGLTNRPFFIEERLDIDHDGMPTWQEWCADTDPCDGASVLLLNSLSQGAAGVVVSWRGGQNATQWLDRGEWLFGDSGMVWRTVHTNVPPTPAVSFYTDEVRADGHAGRGYYRLRAARP